MIGELNHLRPPLLIDVAARRSPVILSIAIRHPRPHQPQATVRARDQEEARERACDLLTFIAVSTPWSKKGDLGALFPLALRSPAPLSQCVEL
jgi:hypothetical protein